MIPRNAMFLIGAAVALGMAINVRDGEYWPRALLFLTVALAFCAAGVLLPDRPVEP